MESSAWIPDSDSRIQKKTGPQTRFGKIVGSKEALNEARFLQSGEGAILVDGLERLARGLDLHIFAKLGNPDTLGVKVWRNLTLNGLGDVTTDAAFFLGQTRTVDFTSNTNFGTADAAYF